MPRAKTDLACYSLNLGPATLADLDLIAAHHEWPIEAGRQKGEPNRSRAVRELAHREARRIERLRARRGGRP